MYWQYGKFSERLSLNTWNLKNKSKFSIEVNPKIKNITCFMYIHCQLNKCVVKWCSHDMNHCYGHNFPVETCLKECYLITIIIPNPNMELKRMDIHVHHNQSIWHSGALRNLLDKLCIHPNQFLVPKYPSFDPLHKSIAQLSQKSKTVWHVSIMGSTPWQPE